MKGDKAITGIIVILTMVLMGGTVGMATSYYLMSNAVDAEIEGNQFKTLDQELEQKNEKPANTEEIETKIESPIEQKQPSVEIHTEHMEELQQALDIWKEIMFQTARGELSYEDAGKLLYSVSGDIYKRNLPEEFSTYWLRSAMKHRKDPENTLKEIQFSEVGQEKDGVTLVSVAEVYAKTTASYQLKLKKENGQWRFISQIIQ
ncbi:hypothetical protein HNQ80_000094 [Anaerosolibacter carboniphilus]|uniref:Uncharacterized protein n=1 Tax=Anaerosolibacter carboniphilus TaxID=1417629 RepID=A0A841KV25_9FIRM|nr:hypothetical protein [Anaerosolibacter carboniphilus]MBB6214025.1 hypothetical protein [Anaerosolibacter carboniphilus]